MKMKNYRLFLLGFVTISLVLLTGFQSVGVKKAVLTERNTASVKLKKAQYSNKENPLKSNRNKTTSRHVMPNADEDAELQKTLDLSLPFNASDNAALTTEPSRVGQEESSTLFSADRKKLRPVALDGEMLMSQEPEVDKKKSLDGAGIVITLKR